MNIAILHPSLDIYGGAERQVLNLANELEKIGNEVTIYTSKLNVENCFPELSSKLNIIETGGIGCSKGFRYVVITSPIFMRVMAKKIGKDHEILNCHNFPSNIAAYFYKRNNPSKPVVWMCNDPPPWYREPDIVSKNEQWKLIYKLLRFYFEKLDKVSVNSIDKIVVLDSRNQKLIKMIYGRNSEIVRTGLDTKHLKKVDKNLAIDKYNLCGKIVVLTVNRLEKQKRIDDFILAISLLRHEFPNILGIIVGDGSQKYELKQLVKKLGCEKNTIFTGFIKDEDLISLYKACDIFVFSAINQTWGLAPLEAMTCGKPCIISIGAGVSEVLKDGVTALFVKPKTPKQIAKKIKQLIINKRLYITISKNSQHFVEKTLNWRNYAKQMLKFFEPLL